MFFSRYWNVLVVDDEKDVLDLTRLIMRDYRVYGIPLNIMPATSKAEATDLLETSLLTRNGWSPMAAAFIDVVMETDSAGLELCQFIREEQGNNVTQLFVRTGQPGIAPEREVIDRYDITGYVTKIDATEERLYSLTKTCIRQYRWVSTERWVLNAIQVAISAAGSRERILAATERHLRQTLLTLAGGANESMNVQMALSLDGRIPIKLEIGEARFAHMHDRLMAQPSVSLGNDDLYVLTDEREFLIKIPETARNSEVVLIGRAANDPPGFIFSGVHAWLKSLGILWQRAT